MILFLLIPAMIGGWFGCSFSAYHLLRFSIVRELDKFDDSAKRNALGLAVGGPAALVVAIFIYGLTLWDDWRL